MDCNTCRTRIQNKSEHKHCTQAFLNSAHNKNDIKNRWRNVPCTQYSASQRSASCTSRKRSGSTGRSPRRRSARERLRRTAWCRLVFPPNLCSLRRASESVERGAPGQSEPGRLARTHLLVLVLQNDRHIHVVLPADGKYEYMYST